MDKNFASNLLSQEKCLRNSVFGMSKIKIIYDLHFLIAICSPENDNKHPSEIRN